MTHDPPITVPKCSLETSQSVAQAARIGHDPLCPVVANPVTMILHSGAEIIVGSYCQCELIEKVRADTVEQIWLDDGAPDAKRGEP
jgi:hypothetical protein